MNLQPGGMPGLTSLPATVPQKKLSDNTQDPWRHTSGQTWRPIQAIAACFPPCHGSMNGRSAPQAIHLCSFFARSSLPLFRLRQVIYIQSRCSLFLLRMFPCSTRTLNCSVSMPASRRSCSSTCPARARTTAPCPDWSRAGSRPATPPRPASASLRHPSSCKEKRSPCWGTGRSITPGDPLRGGPVPGHGRRHAQRLPRPPGLP